jgi:hypothetical protein
MGQPCEFQVEVTLWSTLGLAGGWAVGEARGGGGRERPHARLRLTLARSGRGSQVGITTSSSCIRYRASRPTLSNTYLPHTFYFPSNPSAAGASFNSFSSWRGITTRTFHYDRFTMSGAGYIISDGPARRCASTTGRTTARSRRASSPPRCRRGSPGSGHPGWRWIRPSA